MSQEAKVSQFFSRKLWCLMGLPLDAVGMEETLESVRSAANDGRRLFLTTPNLNFVVASLNDPSFRNSVINSDLSVADGMPLIWVARLLGIPIHERVAGSGLFEALMGTDPLGRPPIRAFFFGGEEGVAERACQRLNEEADGIVGVGSYCPGFGTVEQMSTREIIGSINDSGANFLVVSLGAKKGQKWIEQNLDRLQVPVVSHLGAVVNFVAGTKARAPATFQKMGLEWLWRIKEEPKLFQRYFYDGLFFLSLVITREIPYVVHNTCFSKKPPESRAAVGISEENNGYLVSFSGVLTSDTLSHIRSDLAILRPRRKLSLDLEGVQFADSSFIGLVFLLMKLSEGKMEVVNVSNRVEKIFNYNSANFLIQ
jgi:N-acetylglucosaminyldiphosphoundecaprenol N-acetyl-beta-D-mannosaminyltransferase